MAIVGLVVGGVLLLAMTGVSIRGWLTLPADARVPVHGGIGGYSNYVSKKPGLILWPTAGALIYAIFAGIFVGAVHPNHASAGASLLILPIVLAVLLAVQMGAIRAANRGVGAGSSLRY